MICARNTRRKKNQISKQARLSQIAAFINALMMVGIANGAESATANSSPEADNANSAKKKEEAKKPEKKEEATLDEVLVSAKSDSYKTNKLSSSKYTEPLLDVPQTIQVVPQAVIKDQNATSLRDVLRNVPGISFQAGEGGTTPGDNLFIRGFSARNNIFVDGVRDFGMYSRDPFNLEQVEVIKGPNSVYGGKGSTGGSVNMVTKSANMTPSYGADFGYGTNEYYRTTVDVNQPIPEFPIAGTSFRATGLLHDQNFSAIDGLSEQRWGIAPSLAFGLGTDTRLKLEHFHLSQDNVPTYGFPNPSIIGGGYELPKSMWHNFYGLESRDYEYITTDNFKAKIEHDINEDVTVSNQTTWGQTIRDSIITAPRRATGSPVGPTAIIGRQDWKSRDQTDSIVANQTTLNAKFNTASLKHNIVTAVEYSSEEEIAYTRASTAPTALAQQPTTSLLSPDPSGAYPYSFYRTGARNKSVSDTIAWSFFDTIELTEQWELNGGVRVDHYETDYQTRAANGAVTDMHSLDVLPSWRVGLVYKPRPNGSIYFNYANSFDPSAENLTLSTANVNLDPEESDSYELGTKWDFFNGDLSVTTALFRTDKTNARVTDPVNATLQILSGQQRAEGVEVGASGNITDSWKVYGGYSYTRTEILSSTTAADVGNQMVQAPEQTASLWTTYTLPFKLEVGTGVQYMDKSYSNTTNTLAAPSYWLQSMMLHYPINKNWSAQFNIQNLWDVRYIDRITGGQSIPGAGRTFIVSTSLKF